MSVFDRANCESGNYEVFGTSIKQLFMPLSATILEEYGIPYQVTLKIEKNYSLGDRVDEILSNVKGVKSDEVELSKFEQEMLDDLILNL